MREKIKDFTGFIRLKVCFIICSIALCGYLLFNPLGIYLFLILVSSFFGTAGAYAFNNMNDKEEDLINRKRINPFVQGKNGFLIITVCFIIAIAFSLFLPPFSMLFSFIGVASSMVYSQFKVKKYSIMKNLYTAAGVGTSFLVGSMHMDEKGVVNRMFDPLRDWGDVATNVRGRALPSGHFMAEEASAETLRELQAFFAA